ncbi:DUF3298 and DUF4163 domain-containing protein [Bacillus sp. JJ722]|uniref:DUF3298 and DUF4163 domain-containing protein n=1 Tax=Bacillus sp. JJ722 TaxID=3122973 RepID=UPI002FFF192A
MKKFNFLKVIILFVLILGVFSIGTIQSEAASNPIKGATVHYKGIKDLAYPKLSGIKNSNVQNEINTFFQKNHKSHYQAYNELMKGMKEIQGDEMCVKYPSTCNYSYKTSYKLAYQDSNYISVIIYTDAYTGGAHGLRRVDTFNFNIKTGKRILLPNVVSPSKATKTKQYILNYFKKYDLLFNDVTVKDIYLNNETSFIFTKTGVSVIFQEYEIAPYSAGNPKANVPKSVYK